jgi:hypothetical protein
VDSQHWVTDMSKAPVLWLRCRQTSAEQRASRVRGGRMATWETPVNLNALPHGPQVRRGEEACLVAAGPQDALHHSTGGPLHWPAAWSGGMRGRPL